jgi:hypothetical protein
MHQPIAIPEGLPVITNNSLMASMKVIRSAEITGPSSPVRLHYKNDARTTLLKVSSIQSFSAGPKFNLASGVHPMSFKYRPSLRAFVIFAKMLESPAVC